MEYEFTELTKQVSKQREQIHCIKEFVKEKETEVTGLQADVEILQSWIQTARKVQEIMTESSRLYIEAESAIVQESAVENRAQVGHPDLAARVRLGEEMGESLSMLSQLGSAQTKLAGIFGQRPHRLHQELDAAKSLLHFAKLELDALTTNHEVVQNSLAAKIAFLHNINSLSDEVLCQIFGMVVDEELHDRETMMMDINRSFHSLDVVDAPLRLGAVSHEWRRIVESHSPLWKGIVVNFRVAATAFERPVAGRKEQRQLEQIDYYLSRSRGVDLDLLIYVAAGTYEYPFLASIASRFQSRVVRQICIRARHLRLQCGLDLAADQPTLNRFLSLLPTARIINLTPWKWAGDQGATDPTFFPGHNWLSGCKLFTSFGLHPLLPMQSAPSVRSLSITRTSCKPGWDLAAILAGFPNLTHLEIDPTLKGHDSSLEVTSPPLPLSLKSLVHITTSAAGLDDLNKIADKLELPSFHQLTLRNSSSSLPLSALAWAAFIGGAYSAQLTILEIIQSAGPVLGLDQLTALHTLKLLGSAVRIGLETLPSLDTRSLPPNLKDVYFYDSSVDDSVVRTAGSQLIELTKTEIRFHRMS